MKMDTLSSERLKDDDTVDFMSILKAIQRGLWIIVATAVVSLALAFAYIIQIAEPRYASTTTLSIEVRSQNVFDFDSVLSGVSAEDSALNTEIEVILSRTILRRVVERLDLTSDPFFNESLRPKNDFDPKVLLRSAIAYFRSPQPALSEEALARRQFNGTIDALRESISAQVVRDSYVYRVTVTTNDPEKSARIANIIANEYVEDQIRSKLAATERAVGWLSDRVTSLEAELDKQVGIVNALRSSTDIVTPEILQARELQATDLRRRKADLQEQLEQVRFTQTDVRDAVAAEDWQRLAVVSDDTTLLQILRRGTATSGAALETTIRERAAQILLEIERDIVRAENQIMALDRSLASLEGEILAQTENFNRLTQLEREADATRVLYESILQRLRETTVQLGLQEADSRILSEAIRGVQTEPRNLVILFISGVLGIMVGLLLLWFREVARNGFVHATEVEEATGIAVIGQIPVIPAKNRSSVMQYLIEKPTSFVNESYRNLRTSLLMSDIDNPPQLIMSTSSMPGEGKTTQAIALALHLAGMNQKVILVECDIRRQTLKQYFDSDEASGILDVVSGDVPLEAAVVQSDQIRADVLLGQKSRINAADFFASQAFIRFLEDLRNKYDIIILDAPPVLAVPDARVIAPYVDAVLYTVAWMRTPTSMVKEGINLLRTVKAPLAGIALSQINIGKMKNYGYGGETSHYGAFYGNASKYHEN